MSPLFVLRGKSLRAREYAADSELAWELRTQPEFAGEELTDAEISRLVGLYHSHMKKLWRFPS